MIIIKYIPNIIKDEGRLVKELLFVPDKSIRDYLIDSGFDFKQSKIIVSGATAKDLNKSLKNDDEVIITPGVELPVGFLGLSVFWVNLINIVLLVVTVAYSIYSYVSRPRTPSMGTIGEGLDEGSPTYGWDGISNTQSVGTPVAIVYGEHRVGGNIINQFIRTDGDKEYLNVLIAVGEGEIESISSVEINENPSTNFDDIALSYRYGTNTQTQIPSFNDSHDLKALSANLLKNNTYSYTTVNTDITCFELKLTCVGGLFKSNETSGATESWAVTYNVRYKLHSSPSYIDAGSTTIDGMSRSDLRRVFRVADLTAGQYDIQITRTSDDSSLSPLLQGDLYLKGVDEITQDEPLIYPNTALLGVEALATDQLSGSTPTITSLIKGKKINIPNVLTADGGVLVDWDLYYWDPLTSLFKLLSDDTVLYWDTVSYVTAYSANPIWCFKDLISNTRYGLGDYITVSNIDVAQFLEMAKYCEERVSDGAGGWEKRFRLDVVIDSETRAIDLLTQLTSTFRAFTFYSNGVIKLKIDKPESPVQLFGMGNIISESFTQSWKSIKDIPNVIEIQFMNKDLNYKQEVISVMNEASIAAGDPIRKKSLRLFCTRTSQAVREGKYALNIATCIQRTVSLKASIDAIACQAGDPVNVAHDVPQWGIGSGRIQTGSTTTVIKLDQPVILAISKIYKIRIRFADDTQEERYISDAPGTYTELGVTVAFSAAPADYDVYSVGEEGKVVAPYRIVAMKRSENSEVEISALEYDADVYDTDTIALPDNNYSALTFAIPPVENLTLSEGIIIGNDGSVMSTIEVSFTKPIVTGYVLKRYNRAKIYLSDNAGASYRPIDETYGEYYQITGGLSIGSYKVLVASISDNGEESSRAASPTATIILVGKDSNPSNVVNFSYTFLNALVFTWDKNTDKDLQAYEIRDVDSNWGVQDSHLIYRGFTNTFTITLPASRTPGTYYIKALDTSGNYSTISVSVTPSNAAPTAPVVTATIWFGMATLDWTDSADTDLKYYEVLMSTTNAWAGEETVVKKVSGLQANIQGLESVAAAADAVDATSITDADLIGAGVNFYYQKYLRQTTGTYKDQVAIILSSDNDTGKLTVASWPSGTPSVNDEFTITDRAFFKVRGVDTYGAGTLSAGTTISFDPLSEFLLADGSVTESKIADGAVTALKLYAGEIITYSAQIKDAIITNAKIYEMVADKIRAGTLTAQVGLGAGGKVILDGANSVIKIYDADDNLRVEIGRLS